MFILCYKECLLLLFAKKSIQAQVISMIYGWITKVTSFKNSPTRTYINSGPTIYLVQCALLQCLDVKGCPTQGDKYYQLSKVYTKKEMATSVAQSAFNASFTNKLIKSKKNIQVNWSSSITKNGFATLTFLSNYIKSLLKKKKQA